MYDTKLNSLVEAMFGGSIVEYDIIENEDHVVLETPLPGYEKNQISVDVVNNTLLIEAENHRSNQNYIRKGITYGKITRKFNIPDGLDSSKISAKLEHGVLKVSIGINKKQKSKILVQ